MFLRHCNAIKPHTLCTRHVRCIHLIIRKMNVVKNTDTGKELSLPKNTTQDLKTTTTTTQEDIHESNGNGSIQERMLFNKVFESMELKREEKQKEPETTTSHSSNNGPIYMDQSAEGTQYDDSNSSTLNNNNTSHRSSNDLTVSFGKYDDLKSLYYEMNEEPFDFQDSKINSLISNFSKLDTKEAKMGSLSGEPAGNNNNNENNGNFSQSNNGYESNLKPQPEFELPIFKFLDGIEHELSQIKKKTLESTTENNLRSSLNKNIERDIKLSETDKKRIVREEMYKSELKRSLNPYLSYLSQNVIKSDYDMWKYFESLLTTYINRDRVQRKKLLKLTSEETIKYIDQECTKDITKIPEPYETTMPCIVLELLTNETQWHLPSERRYQLAMYIYNQIKTYPDITMYLYFGTVEFYNLLIELNWINYKDVTQIHNYLIEMQNNGIQGDLTTLDHLNKILSTMRSLNDDIMDSKDYDTLKENNTTVAVLWSKDIDNDIIELENRSQRLKRQLVPGSI